MRHVDEGALHAHLDGELATLGEARAAEVERHLQSCVDCRAALEQARSERDRATAILRGAEPAADPLPTFARVRERAPSPARATAARPARRGAALAWVASFVLALGAGWLARGGLRTHSAAEVAVQESRALVAAAPAPVSHSQPASQPAASKPAASDAPAAGVQAATRPALPAPPPSAPGRKPDSPQPEITVATASTEALAPRVLPSDSATIAAGRAFVIRGTVTDEHDRPLAGAQVTLPAIGRGVLSDREGKYALSVPAMAVGARDTLTVVARLIGMERQSHLVPVALGRAEQQDFRLATATVALDALVVTSGDLRRARSEPRAAPAAAPITDAGVAVVWQPVTPPAAAQWLGRAPLAVPELEVVRSERATVGGVRAVRVTQRLDAGEVLVLVQMPAGAPAAARATAAPGARASRSRDGLEVLADAPLPADSLRGLLERLR